MIWSTTPYAVTATMPFSILLSYRYTVVRNQCDAPFRSPVSSMTSCSRLPNVSKISRKRCCWITWLCQGDVVRKWCNDCSSLLGQWLGDLRLLHLSKAPNFWKQLIPLVVDELNGGFSSSRLIRYTSLSQLFIHYYSSRVTEELTTLPQKPYGQAQPSVDLWR